MLIIYFINNNKCLKIINFKQNALIKNEYQIFLILVSLFELELYDLLCLHKNVCYQTNLFSQQTLFLII